MANHAKGGGFSRYVPLYSAVFEITKLNANPGLVAFKINEH